MTTCHARRRLTLYVVQGRWWNALPDVVLLYFLPKGHAGMPCLTSSECVWSPKTTKAWNARRFSTVCAVQGIWFPAILDVVWPCVLPKDNDGMPCPTSSDRMWYPREIIARHAGHCQTVCSALGRWWHTTPNVIGPWMLLKVNDCMSRPTSSLCVSQGR